MKPRVGLRDGRAGMNVFVGSYLDPNIHGTLKPRRGGSLACQEEKVSLWVYAWKPGMEVGPMGAR